MTLRQSIRFATAHDGVRIAYATSGSGPPLLKVGTWMTHLEFDLGSPVWGHLLVWLSQRFTLLRYDQRGNGLSDWNVDDLSFEAWVRDLGTVIDASGRQRVALLGLSQGAPVAIAYAARHPERVSHLIVHGGYARGRRRRGADAAPEALDAALIPLIEHGWGGEDASFRQFFTSQFVPDGTPEQLLEAALWPASRVPVVIVGHQPTLGSAVAYLLAMQHGSCPVRKGAVWWIRNRERDGHAQTMVVTVQSPDSL